MSYGSESSMDAIQEAAYSEAEAFVPMRSAPSVEDALGHIPFFQLWKNPLNGKYRAYMHNMDKTHPDHRVRANMITEFLNDHVLGLVSPAVNVSGFYRIEVDDTYTYLPARDEYMREGRQTLVFTRDELDSKRNVPFFPDLYQITDFSGKLDKFSDTTEYEKKIPKLIGAFTCTGSRDPAKNDRLRAAYWSIQNRDISEVYMTAIPPHQMDMGELLRVYPESTLNKMVAQFVHPLEQYRFKYNFNIDGNATAWDRIPMMMNSRTQVIKLDSHGRFINWYYRFMRADLHYIRCQRIDDLRNVFMAAQAENPAKQKMRIQEANSLVASYMRRFHAAQYVCSFLERAAENKA